MGAPRTRVVAHHLSCDRWCVRVYAADGSFSAPYGWEQAILPSYTRAREAAEFYAATGGTYPDFLRHRYLLRRGALLG